jgi:hypothetical protein
VRSFHYNLFEVFAKKASYKTGLDLFRLKEDAFPNYTAEALEY